MLKTQVDPEFARAEWKFHKRVSWVFYGILMFIVMGGMIAGLRYLKAAVLFGVLPLSLVLIIFLFFISGNLVIKLMGCVPMDEETLSRIKPMFERLVQRSGLSSTPALYVAAMDVPNAFAFGNGIIGASGIAVTRPLLEILNDNELKAVLAHEIGHIRSHDTTLMTMVTLTLTIIAKWIDLFRHIGRLAFFVAIAAEALMYIPSIIAAAIMQLREYAADAYSAFLTCEIDSLISAFQTIDMWQKTDPTPEKQSLDPFPHVEMDELLLHHPDMENRIQMLKRLERSEK